IFKDKVIERFISSYLSGLTPNPCIDCNRFVKFGPLLERAGLLGCERLATGHYARIVFDPASKRHLLKKARDLSKDQSYFLYCLTQEELARTLFPLGEHSKDKVRDMARSRGLVNAEKPDSQDICFVPDGRYYRFVEQYGPPAKPGDIVNSEGQILGRHVGLHRYTVGQRKRLNICGPEPLYVTGLDPKNNAVAVGQEKELYSVGAVINDVNLIALDKIDKPLEVQARLRYRQKDLPAVVEPLDDGRLLLSFRTPQKAVAPGQAAVFYQDDLVIGGGVIESAKK
ncbi:MAG: tRNA 2-thiouridine(34) synthase MnmA, partial [Deltaproteobacteria bacterium]|nr:tRNA 2-thiouridine(34) synthase MnmA [Deltaproteobacteria bacterium]